MEINYTEDWYMDCPQTKEDWCAFLEIMKKFGVEVYSQQFERGYLFITPSGEELGRWGVKLITSTLTKVDIYGAIQRLTRPVKTAQQVKIEELENTINQAKQQIEELKKEMK